MNVLISVDPLSSEDLQRGINYLEGLKSSLRDVSPDGNRFAIRSILKAPSAKLLKLGYHHFRLQPFDLNELAIVSGEPMTSLRGLTSPLSKLCRRFDCEVFTYTEGEGPIKRSVRPEVAAVLNETIDS